MRRIAATASTCAAVLLAVAGCGGSTATKTGAPAAKDKTPVTLQLERLLQPTALPRGEAELVDPLAGSQ